MQEILADFDVAVVDQWGVLHQGQAPYPQALQALQLLHGHKPVTVLTNSGKRAAENRRRISAMGFADKLIDEVVSSGEVAWRQLREHGKPVRVAPVETCAGDARNWAADSELITVVDAREDFDALLIMGLPDATEPEHFDALLRCAVEQHKPAICTNPDLSSPRAGGLISAPGAVAARFEQLGGKVTWYGKPHAAVFDAVAALFPHIKRDRLLMIGDSLGNDIAGAAQAGFASLLVTSGIHARQFAGPPDAATVAAVCKERQAPLPDFAIEQLA